MASTVEKDWGLPCLTGAGAYDEIEIVGPFRAAFAVNFRRRALCKSSSD